MSGVAGASDEPDVLYENWILLKSMVRQLDTCSRLVLGRSTHDHRVACGCERVVKLPDVDFGPAVII